MNIILLTYVNRSGSTYLANLLDSSPKILACPEGDMLVSFFLENPGGIFKFDEQTESKLKKLFSEDPKLLCWGEEKSFFIGLEKAQNKLEAFIRILINYKNQVKPEAECILFKAERIVFLVGKILKVNTSHNIDFISLVRDPRAVYASQMRILIPETQKLMSKKPVRTSLFWKEHVKRSIKESQRSEFFFMNYEELIIENKKTMKKISDLLSIGLSEIQSGKGNLVKRLSEDHQSIHKNCEGPPDLRKINEWENILNRFEIIKIELITNKILTRLGYQKKYNEFQYLFSSPFIIPEIVHYYLRKIVQKFFFKLGFI